MVSRSSSSLSKTTTITSQVTFVLLILAWCYTSVTSFSFTSHRSHRMTKTPAAQQISSTFSTMNTATRTSSRSMMDEYGSYNEGYVRVKRNIREFCLYYRVYNPEILQSKDQIPLLCAHGGPGLPSQYMYPIVKLFQQDPKRSVIYFDQLGCGCSDQPDDFGLYSTSNSIQDMATLLCEELKLSKVHLLGHSYGGALCYDFTQQYPNVVQSLILSNAPTTMKKANDEYDRLHEETGDSFWNDHVCRTSSSSTSASSPFDNGMPPPLQDAMKHVSRYWGGMDVVIHYTAKPMAGSSPPVICIVGEHDFGIAASAGWPRLIGEKNSLESVVLKNCAHYPFLEDMNSFGTVIQTFCSKHDGQA
mmetsp:Transcript_24100/g.33677  ORF Transcript_24100/g.33677 Transcript_24100/m.33677 type:complete len:360 (-) Transcript_24100:54-1133(-)